MLYKVNNTSGDEYINGDLLGPIELIHVLVVEDNPADASLILEVFDSFEAIHDIDVVGDGVEATDYLYKRGKYKDYATPNLILLDLNLPKKDGREVLKEIKNDDKINIVPVIVLTTSRDESDICGAYRNHANAGKTEGFAA